MYTICTCILSTVSGWMWGATYLFTLGKLRLGDFERKLCHCLLANSVRQAGLIALLASKQWHENR